MTVTTSKGQTMAIDYLWGPVRRTGEVLLHLTDPTPPLSALAEAFEGCAWVERRSAAEGDLRLEGYTELRSLARTPGGVTVTLARPAEGA